MRADKESIAPILKWAGGKRQLLSEIFKYIPKYNTYYEPFVGGGALLFALLPEKFKISDINSELINLYCVIRDKSELLIEELKNAEKYKNDKKTFYYIRALDRNLEKYSKLSDVERAARMLYLNKTCYNGLYRVNSMCEFNCPFGNYKNPAILNKEAIRKVSKYFNESKASIKNEDFSEAIKSAIDGDFVYLDPAYAPISKHTNFTGYSSNGFLYGDHQKLKKICDDLTNKKIKFLQSNSDCEFIRELYKDYEIISISAKRSINSVGSGRGEIREVFIKNY